MRCYRKILHISYKDHVTNEKVRAKIQQAIGTHEDLTIVKGRKLQWYGHVSRSSGLAKIILQGKVKGWRRQGRQRKMWEDNIREWTGLEFGKSQRAVENREKWRKQVAKNICSAPRTHAVKGLMMIMMMYFHLCSTTLLHCWFGCLMFYILHTPMGAEGINILESLLCTVLHDNELTWMPLTWLTS